MADIKYRKVSNPNVGKNLFIALSALGDYGYDKEMTITGLTRDSEKNKSVGGVEGSKHLSGDGMDISSKKDSAAFIDWTKTEQGKRWIDDFGMKMHDETSKKGAPHYHFEASEPKVDVSKYEKVYQDNRNDEGFVNVQKVNFQEETTPTDGKRSMFDKHTQKKIDEIRANHAGKRRELALMKKDEDEDYSAEKAKFDEEVLWVINKEQQAAKKALESKYKIAKNLAKKANKDDKERLLDDAEKYQKELSDLKTNQLNTYRDLGGNLRQKKGEMEDLSESLEFLADDFGAETEQNTSLHDYFAKDNAAEKKKIQDKKDIAELGLKDVDFSKINKKVKEGSGSGTSGVTGGVDYNDKPTGEKVDITGGKVGEKKDWKGEYEKATQELADFKEYSQEQFEHNYAPDQQREGDLFGNLIDAGRTIGGLMAANEEIPVYERGTMFSTAMDEAEGRRNMGLTDTERGYRERQAETGYHYDIKNIRRLAGGSSGVALGNLGRAQTQLQGQYGQIAVADEEARRANRANFQGMALKDEGINRQIFEDELKQVRANKMAGAGLVQDAVANMKERADFNKMYGKGSVYYERNKQLDYDAKKTAFDLDRARTRREEEALNIAEQKVRDTGEAYQKHMSIDGVNNPEQIAENSVFGQQVNSFGQGESQSFGGENPSGVQLDESFNKDYNQFPFNSGIVGAVVGGEDIAEAQDVVVQEGDPSIDTSKDVGFGEAGTYKPKSSVDGVAGKKSTFKRTETPNTEVSTDKSQEESKVAQAETFEKSRRKAYKEELAQLEESAKYGGDDEEKDKIDKLKKALKSGNMLDEDVAKAEEMSGKVSADLSAPKRKGVRKNADGTESSHLMKTEQLKDGSWVSFPSLFQNEDGEWIDMSKEEDWMKVYEEAVKRGEVKKFGGNKDKALKYGEGSWKKK